MDKLLRETFMSNYSSLQNQSLSSTIDINVNTSSMLSSGQNFKIVEKKRKVFYFSKYTIDTSEIFMIAKTIKTLKENVFKILLDAMRYCAAGISS